MESKYFSESVKGLTVPKVRLGLTHTQRKERKGVNAYCPSFPSTE